MGTRSAERMDLGLEWPVVPMSPIALEVSFSHQYHAVGLVERHLSDMLTSNSRVTPTWLKPVLNSDKSRVNNCLLFKFNGSILGWLICVLIWCSSCSCPLWGSLSTLLANYDISRKWISGLCRMFDEVGLSATISSEFRVSCRVPKVLLNGTAPTDPTRRESS